MTDSTTTTDRSIVDRLLTWLRREDDGEADNRALARGLWLVLSLAVVGGGAYVYLALTYPSSVSNKYALASDFIGFVAVAGIFWAFLGSLVGPSLRIERWLDRRYPNHCVDEFDFSLVSDVWSSVLLTVYLGTYATALFMIVEITAFGLTVLDGMSSVTPLTESSVSELTILNSVGLLMIAVLFSAYGFIWLADTTLKSELFDHLSVETNGFSRFGHVDAANGGDADGA